MTLSPDHSRQVAGSGTVLSGTSVDPSAVDRTALYGPVCLAALLVVLDSTAAWRIPWREVLPWLYVPVLAALAGGVFLCCRLRCRGVELLSVLLLVLLSIYVPTALLHGRWLPDPIHAISIGFDDFCYQALADHLYHNPRGAEHGLSYLDEFGSHLQNSRFSTPALLSLLGSKLLFRDPPMSHFALGALCLAVYFSSMFYLGRALFRSSYVAAAVAFLAATAGWVNEVLELANYDNLVFLALAPAFVGVLIRLQQIDRRPWGLVLAGGLLLAALCDTYVEGFVLFGVLLVPVAIAALVEGRGRIRLVGLYVVLLIIAGILAAPCLKISFTWLFQQFQSGMATSKGEPTIFPGLMDQRRLPAFFALGEEAVGNSYKGWDLLLPAVLVVLMVVGAISLRKSHGGFAWVGVSLAALLFWQNVLKSFDYGTYKVLNSGGWWIYPCIVAGVLNLTRRLPNGSTGVALGVLTVAISWEKQENRMERAPLPVTWMPAIRELAEVRFVTRDKPVLLDIGEFGHTWAVYYLRHLPITTFKQRGTLSMPHLAPLLSASSAPPPESAAFVLVEGVQANAVWANSGYSLLPLPGAYVAAVTGPWAAELPPYLLASVWVGTQPEVFRIRSPAAGSFELSCTALDIGPRAPQQDHVLLEIVDASGAHQCEWRRGTPPVLPIHLEAGENQVSIRCVETPMEPPKTGDTREVMFRLVGYAVKPAP